MKLFDQRWSKCWPSNLSSLTPSASRLQSSPTSCPLLASIALPLFTTLFAFSYSLPTLSCITLGYPDKKARNRPTSTYIFAWCLRASAKGKTGLTSNLESVNKAAPEVAIQDDFFSANKVGSFDAKLQCYRHAETLTAALSHLNNTNRTLDG